MQKMFKTSVEIESADIRGMDQMNPEEYRHYVSNHMLYVDHHDILRSHIAGYPMANNKEQLDILIEVLGELRSKLKDA
ncbi:hypothetical protein HL658_16845 [Azospirillum sp. RWY-5-1]|uniref:Uncharacterized protein n=1 Tax=Azospirillum oleiclasticum TaxID=2735135 RepID=A0ABX2TG96_9PROT|nr:hypothetical protein [Azospirillum oleiclasticum]NYZ14226.1 hypothetical protein [Azospirillum oleiclasticum]NYZ21710.1 hypothetical protein [Azospirillum oleiclasticum]